MTALQAAQLQAQAQIAVQQPNQPMMIHPGMQPHPALPPPGMQPPTVHPQPGLQPHPGVPPPGVPPPGMQSSPTVQHSGIPVSHG